MKVSIKKLLVKVLNRIQPIGNTYTASWTATSSNANNVRVTNTLTLPAGTYLFFLKVPVCNQSTLYFQVWSGTDDNNYITAGNVSGAGQSVFSCVATYSQTTTVYGRTNFSMATTYSYLERGYLKAVRIA